MKTRVCQKAIESLIIAILAHKYWSDKYSDSFLAVDFQHKKQAWKRVLAKAEKLNLSKKEVDQIMRG